MYVLCRGLQGKEQLADFWKHKRQAIFYGSSNNVPKALAHVEMAKKCLVLVPFSFPARANSCAFIQTCACTYSQRHMHARVAHAYVRTDVGRVAHAYVRTDVGHDAKSVAYQRKTSKKKTSQKNPLSI